MCIRDRNTLLSKYEVHEQFYEDAGQFLPMSVWANKGFDTSMILERSSAADRRMHPVLGETFRVKLLTTGTKGMEGSRREDVALTKTRKRLKTTTPADEDPADATPRTPASPTARAPPAKDSSPSSNSTASSTDSSSSDSSKAKKSKKTKKAKKYNKTKKAKKNKKDKKEKKDKNDTCLLYTSPSPRDS